MEGLGRNGKQGFSIGHWHSLILGNIKKSERKNNNNNNMNEL